MAHERIRLDNILKIYWILTKDEQELLGAAQSEDGDETAAFPIHNIMDGVTKASFSFLSLLMDVGSVCRLLWTGREGVQATVLNRTHDHPAHDRNYSWDELQWRVNTQG